MNESLEEDRGNLNNFLDSLFTDSTDGITDITDDVSIIDNKTSLVNLDEVNQTAMSRSTDIIEHLSGYYFDKRYIEEHPYIKNKISQEIDNIRRLLKMLAVNEKAQDSLIATITCFSNKSALYTALTSLQNSILSIQKQLDESINSIEEIFRKMQDECKTTFDAKEKEILDDGSIVSRGTRDFLKELTAKLQSSEIIDEDTGEIIKC